MPLGVMERGVRQARSPRLTARWAVLDGRAAELFLRPALQVARRPTGILDSPVRPRTGLVTVHDLGRLFYRRWAAKVWPVQDSKKSVPPQGSQRSPSPSLH